MDAVATLLHGPRAHGAFLVRLILRPPWSIRLQDESPLKLLAIVRGEAWIVPDRDDAVRLRAGDLAIVRGTDHCTVANAPETPPQVIIQPGEDCATLQGKRPPGMIDMGFRSLANGTSDGSTVILSGTYRTLGETSERLLAALPSIVTVANDPWNSPLIPLLDDEIVRDQPGQVAVLDRLLDLLLTSALRNWFASLEGKAPGWYRAYDDPIVGRALALLHQKPARPWTVGALAAETGIPRSSLARRFTELVGESPMSYLTGWRLALAADLLAEDRGTVEDVAQQVGYATAFAFSAAFKRVRGISPSEYRARMLRR